MRKLKSLPSRSVSEFETRALMQMPASSSQNPGKAHIASSGGTKDNHALQKSEAASKTSSGKCLHTRVLFVDVAMHIDQVRMHSQDPSTGT